MRVDGSVGDKQEYSLFAGRGGVHKYADNISESLIIY